MTTARFSFPVLCFCLLAAPSPSRAASCGQLAIEHELEIHAPGEEPTAHLQLTDALDILNVPSLSIAVIEDNKIDCDWTKSGRFGGDWTRTHYARLVNTAHTTVYQSVKPHL